MTGRICGLLVAGWSLFACSPSAAQARDTTPPQQAGAQDASPAAATTAPVVTAPPKASADETTGFSCTVDIEVRDAHRARGTGRSSTDPEQARKKAWGDACADLKQRSGLDCEDESRVRVVKRSSSTSVAVEHGESRTHYEQTYELVGFRETSGLGRSATSRADACQVAADNACQALLGAACPADRVTVLRTDQAPEGPPPARNTI